ncbi:hypothetical protein [Alicyclobacillus acidoterrestris]|uniref:hypothetical protein n=1 Tax=Alicyclobacillus TaxID=29330 RepID=UPI000386D780|nr:hypothetical protein N007_16750 [Alicyclobacillus acidoterrestris ATCC 49025]
MGVFGGYTRWAVVFLIIFVLFFLLCPTVSYSYVGAPAPGISTASCGNTCETAYGAAGTMEMGAQTYSYGGGIEYQGYNYPAYDYTESESSM